MRKFFEIWAYRGLQREKIYFSSHLMARLVLTSIPWLFVPTDGFDSNIVVQQLHPADRLRLVLAEGTVTRVRIREVRTW